MRIIILLTVLMASAFSHAGLLTFEDIAFTGLHTRLNTVSPGYGGFEWDNRWELTTTNLRGYSEVATSGKNFLFNNSGATNLSVSRDDPFDFLGAFFTAPSVIVSASSLKITAYDAAGLVIGVTEHQIGKNPIWIDAYFEGVSTLVFRQNAGWFGMDDFTFRDIHVVASEAGGFLLFVIGLLGLASIRRRNQLQGA